MSLHPDLFWPDAQVEVEACLQQQVLHIVWVDGEVEVQRVSQQLVGFLIALPKGNHTTQDRATLALHKVAATIETTTHASLSICLTLVCQCSAGFPPS